MMVFMGAINVSTNQELLRQKILDVVRELAAVKDQPPDDATKAKFHELNQLVRQLERGPQVEQVLRQWADLAGLGQEWLDQVDQMALQSWHPNTDEAFARKLLELIVSAGDDGLDLQELVAATGASIEQVENMLERLRTGGYLQPPQQRPKH
jgi:hypothetical protein